GRRSSPCTRGKPQRGFSAPSRVVRSRRSWGIGERPGETGCVHLSLIRRWCRARRVGGETVRWRRRARGGGPYVFRQVGAGWLVVVCRVLGWLGFLPVEPHISGRSGRGQAASA